MSWRAMSINPYWSVPEFQKIGPGAPAHAHEQLLDHDIASQVIESTFVRD
jgi:hypothetical protein